MSERSSEIFSIREKVDDTEPHDFAIFVTEANGRIADWLPRAAAIFGWSGEEITGQLVGSSSRPRIAQRARPGRRSRPPAARA